MKKGMAVFCILVAGLFTLACTLCVRALVKTVNVTVGAMGEAENPLKIVLDAGHGGVDGGVSGIKTGVKESDINLSIVMKLKPMFEDAGFETVLTRKTEAGLYGAATKGFKKRDMQKRKEIVEEAAPALVLSVHQNYYPSVFYRGGQVFFCAENGEGKALATCVQTKLNALYRREGARDRTALSGDYFMLKLVPAPSIIVECGFLSNAKDEALLALETFQKELASAIFSGVLEYVANVGGA